ncbi:MAG: DUF4870 domain-containing protein [bacterium]|nr:DUF4870 domain-containing protein [bacterium]
MTGQKEINNWAMFCHLSALSCYIGIPFGNIIGPLVIWLIKKDEMPFVSEQGKEALNFQISMTIYAIISAFLMFVIVGFFLLFAIVIINLIFVILAAVKVSKGESYKYPLAIRFLK